MTAIQEYSQTEAALAELRERYAGATYDVTTAEGMEAAREARREVKGYRVELEKTRKEIKAPALEHCRLIDAEAKRITEELRKLEDPIDAQIKEEEARKERERQEKIEAERLRVQTIRDRIDWFTKAEESVRRQNLTADEIQEALDMVVGFEVLEAEFEEFTKQAEDTKADAVMAIREWLHTAREREAEAKRLAAEREALEAERRKEREEREAREEEERKAREAEQERLRAERVKLEAELRELAEKREAAEAAERKRREEKERKREMKAARELKVRERLEREQREKYPGDQAIIESLAESFGVGEAIVLQWLRLYGKEKKRRRSA